jgi:two-component system, sensor histidine kinase LadS
VLVPGPGSTLLRRAIRLLVVALGFLLAPRLATAGDALVIAEGELRGEKLGAKVGILEDRGGAFTIEQVVAPPLSDEFQRSHEDVPGFGLKRSAYWVRFDVDNQLAEKKRWLLELGYPPLDDVRLFVPRDDGAFDERRTGDHLPFASRPIAYRTYLFDLDQPPGIQTYYLRVQTSGSVTLPLRAWSPNVFLEHLASDEPPIWIFYGLMLVMAAYNLFVFFSIREAAYLYYVLYIVCYVGFQFSLGGLSFQHLWPNQTWWNGKALTLFIGLSFAFGVLFQRQFLTTWQWSPRLDRWLKFTAGMSFMLALASLVLAYATTIRVLVVWGVYVIVFGVVSACMAAARGSRPAIFYLTAWMILLAGILLYLFRTLGLVPSSFLTDWGLQIGASIEVALLSLGLADRINQMRYDLQVLNRQLAGNVTQLSSALEHAEAATRAKSAFLATVSHELRTPLNAIMNIPEGLLEEFEQVSAFVCDGCKGVFRPDPGEEPTLTEPCPECRALGTLRLGDAWVYQGRPERTARHLGYMHQASKHLLDVVSSILDFSKLEAGRMELDLSDVDLSELLTDVVSPLQHLAQSQGVDLVLAPVPDGGLLRGDRVKIAQIVVNLVGNAIKFSNREGAVRVEAVDEGDAYVIRVRDRGIGIAPADRERIFESFSQVDSGNTRKFGGTGLGLAITKKFVELHGGSIAVESEPGKGSTFSVALLKIGPPALRPESIRTASTASRRPSNRPGAAGDGIRRARTASEVP